MLLQKYVPEPGEAGLFYIRYPHEAEGRITSLTLKFAPCVTGDGRSTLETLVRADTRAGKVPQLYLRRLAARRKRGACRGRRRAAGVHRQPLQRLGVRQWRRRDHARACQAGGRDRPGHPGLPFRPHRRPLRIRGGAAAGARFQHHRGERRRVGGDAYLGRTLHVAGSLCDPVHPLPGGMDDRPHQSGGRVQDRAGYAPCTASGGCSGGCWRPTPPTIEVQQ